MRVRDAFVERMRELEEDRARGGQREVDELRGESADWRGRAARLSGAIGELADANRENVERAAELEGRLLEEKSRAAAEVDEAVRDVRAALSEKVDENAELVWRLRASGEENRALERAVRDLEARNDALASELESTASSLGEAIEGNAALESRAMELDDARRAAEADLAVKRHNLTLSLFLLLLWQPLALLCTEFANKIKSLMFQTDPKGLIGY